MSLSIENIDVGATINNFFKKIKQNVFHYSLQFKKLADDDQSEKFFRYRATINNLSSNVIMQNKDVTVDLIFDVCGTSVTWLSVKTSTIPNSGKGCFLRFDGKEGQLVSCFMGYKVPSAKASIYAFRNIEPCRKSKEDPFLWCFAHFIQHGSLDDANVCVDNEGGIALLRNVKGKRCAAELFMDYNRDAKCQKCSKKMYKTDKPEIAGRKCVLSNCTKKKIMVLECMPCDVFMCQFHYDQHQVVDTFS
jgi:uncharacterized membrane protein